MDQDNEDWLTALVKVTEEYWNGGNRILLLTQAAKHLKSRGIDYKEQTGGRGLKAAIVDAGTDKLRLIKDPNDHLVWGVIPSSVDGDGSLIFEEFQEKKEKEKDEHIRFKPSVWAAFVKTIDSKRTRYIERLALEKFTDIDLSTAAPSDGYILVDSKYLYHSPSEYRNNGKIQKDILEWAAENKLSEELLVSEREYVRKTNDIEDFFVRLSKVDHADLSRVSIPLDVVVKALGKRG